MILDFDPLVSFLPLLLFLTGVFGIGLWSWFQARSEETSVFRLRLKLLFFIGFFLSLCWVLMRPMKMTGNDGEKVLVFSEDLGKAEQDFWKDSLQIKKGFSLSELETGPEALVLVGTDFQKENLARLKGRSFTWLLPETHGLIPSIRWKGYLRKGEKQQVSLRIYSHKTEASLQIGVGEMDSISLQKGWNEKKIEFSVPGQGKSEFPLLLDEDTLVSIRFQIAPAIPKKYSFKTSFPSAESRQLSDWLRKKGERVTEQVQLSRELTLKSNDELDSLQVQVLDPGQLNTLSKEGSIDAFLVLNLSDPQAQIRQINSVFDTEFELRRINEEASRVTGLGALALPFVWEEKSGQKLLEDGSIAIQQSNGKKIAISLLDATFPLILEGKEEAYEEIWGQVFGLLEPEEGKSWLVAAPVLEGFSSSLKYISQDSLIDYSLIDCDTVFFSINPVNPFSKMGEWIPTQTGWQNVEADLSIYSYPWQELSTVHTSEFLTSMNLTSDNSTSENVLKPINPWFGLISMLFFLSLIWIEPKWRF